MALVGRSGYLGLHLGCLAQGRRALEAVPGGGPGARRLARQAVLARRGRGRTAVDAAAGDRPSARRRAHSRRERCAPVEHGLVRRRRHRHSLSALASAARRTAVRRFRRLRHGWLGNSARGDGGQVRPLGECASGVVEVASRCRATSAWSSCRNRRCSTMCSRARPISMRSRSAAPIRLSSIPISRPTLLLSTTSASTK